MSVYLSETLTTTMTTNPCLNIKVVKLYQLVWQTLVTSYLLSGGVIPAIYCDLSVLFVLLGEITVSLALFVYFTSVDLLLPSISKRPWVVYSSAPPTTLKLSYGT